MLPALGGKHDFESGTKAKSWKMCLLGPPIMPVCTLFTQLIATWNLQIPLEKCVFFVYSPFSESTFSIVCFIACLRNEISNFCIASGLILCKKARRTRYFKSESSCNTCFSSPTYKQINTMSVLFLALQAVTISSSCNRRLLIACFPSPIGNCMPVSYTHLTLPTMIGV